MAINQNPRVCTHIKVNGIRCGSPAMREEVFCYFHQRMYRGVPTPPKSRLHPIALFEDEQSIQASLMEIVNALVRNQIDIGRARLIMRALHIAVRNARRVHFQWDPEKMIGEVPQYPSAPESTGPFGAALAQAEALTRVNEPYIEEPECKRIDEGFERMRADAARRKPPTSVKAAHPRRTSAG